MPLVVQVEESGTGRAAEHAFTRSPVRIGRSARNDLCLPHPFVSTWHGILHFDARGVRYTDLGSTNGTLLGGAPVEPRTPVAVGRGATLTIGPLRIALVPPEEAPAPAPPAPAARLEPGGLTALMKRLASVETVDFERAWRQVLVPGAVIGRFELHREIGRGSFGVVFEARDRQLGRLVAFKAVKQGRESQMMFREELLQKEAEAVAQLNHPNIVSLFDAGTCEAGPYLIMELLRGETLRDRLRRGKLPLNEAIEVAIQMAWALDHAHSAGVIHRDVKPANVFLCASGGVKVLDFGIAHVFGAGARRAVGTPAYMAPEQWRDAPQDARTDVFAAAVTLAETLTGRLPYRSTGEWSEVLEPGARPHLSAPGAPPQLVALLRRGLAVDPDRRPHDGGAWLAALLEVNELLDQTPALGVESADRPEPHRAEPHRPEPRAEPARPRPRGRAAPAPAHAFVPPAPPSALAPAWSARTAALVVASIAAAGGVGVIAWLLAR